MFDSEHKTYNNLKVNSVSGLIIKTNPKSFFKTFEIGSEYAKNLLCESPRIMVEKERYYCQSDRYTYESAVVLQIMVCGENRVIAEIMLKEDYDECLRNYDNEVLNNDNS